MRLFLPRFLWAVVAFLVLVVLGTAGYVLIEGVSAYDAPYMTVITVTAVGYEEAFPLGPAGRNFTMALLLSGITVMGVRFGRPRAGRGRHLRAGPTGRSRSTRCRAGADHVVSPSSSVRPTGSATCRP